MSTKHLYHFHAFHSPVPGQQTHLDGIATMSRPITTGSDYDALKALVGRENDVPAECLVIASLTPLGQREDAAPVIAPTVTEIVVNGRRFAINLDVIEYADVVELAGRNASVLHTITWSTPDRGGILSPGDKVIVSPGMVFNAVVTGDA